MKIQEQVSLSDYSTMRLGGKADYLTVVENKNDVVKAVSWAHEHEQAILILGGGSNVIFTDEGFRGLVIVNKITGISAMEDDVHTTLTIGAGENWDNVVQHSVDMGLTGIECLSLIPGTSGGTPVQNVGAYGQQIGDTLYELEVFDINEQKFVIFDNDACEFSYRDSIFKQDDNKQRYVITQITLRLTKGTVEPPLYKALDVYIQKNNVPDYSPQEIRKAVIAIRSSKLPNPEFIANTGSFFVNPVVDADTYEDIQRHYPDMPSFKSGAGYKIPAGWMIEQVGFKNYRHDGGMGTYEKHALVLVNYHAKSYHDLEVFKTSIVQAVHNRFRVTLQQEPETIGA